MGIRPPGVRNKSGQARGKTINEAILSMWRWAIGPITGAQYSWPAPGLCVVFVFLILLLESQISKGRLRCEIAG